MFLVRVEISIGVHHHHGTVVMVLPCTYLHQLPHLYRRYLPHHHAIQVLLIIIL